MNTNMYSLQRENDEGRYFNVKYAFVEEDVTKNITKKTHYGWLLSADSSYNVFLWGKAVNSTFIQSLWLVSQVITSPYSQPVYRKDAHLAIPSTSV